MKRIIRIFPIRTSATPDDELVRIGTTPSLFDEADEVHISVAFTWHRKWAEWAAKQWAQVAPVKIGGAAYNEPGGEFTPGMYLKKGYVITSRGCPNRCWFCSVPKREGGIIRELPITQGWNIADDNLLACSSGHISAVFDMLDKQQHRPQFTGGLEAALLTQETAQRLYKLKPTSLFFAYDTPNDLLPLVEAGKLLRAAGFPANGSILQCYVLAGYEGDTFDKAIKRMGEAWKAGFLPFAMIYRDEDGQRPTEWRKFQWEWTSPQKARPNCIKHFGQMGVDIPKNNRDERQQE